MTPLERFEMMGTLKGGVLEHEIRRALAIAQAVEESNGPFKRMIERRADELLAPKRIAPGFIGALERREGEK